MTQLQAAHWQIGKPNSFKAHLILGPKQEQFPCEDPIVFTFVLVKFK